MISLFTYETRQRIVKALPPGWEFTMSDFRFQGTAKNDDEVLEMILLKHKLLRGDLELIQFYTDRVKEGVGLK